MEDRKDAFRVMLAEICSCVESHKYNNSCHIAFNLTRLAWMLKSKEDMFIAKTTYSSLFNMIKTINHYIVPDVNIKHIHEKLINYIVTLQSQRESQEDTYEVLMQLKYYTTLFNYDTIQLCDKDMNKGEIKYESKPT